MGQSPETNASPIQIGVFGMSDVGQVRKNNEDNFVVCNLSTGEATLTPALCDHQLGPRGTLFMVADGMGGEASGEVASQICVTTVPKRLYENLKSVSTIRETNFVLLLREAVEYANQIIFQRAQTDANFRGMGTTTTAAALFGPHLFIAQVGDSRAYLLRNQQITQLTRDQTYLNYLAEIGAEVPEDPEKDSRRSILTQAVGSSESVDVKVTYTKLRQGDNLLLCSDGLYNMVKASDLLDVMQKNGPLPEMCRTLIGHANANGGVDNITVIVANLQGAGLAAQDPASGVELREFREEDFQARV
ncbi:MAG: serine/threonine-protein phosphatase [Acidobacteria bacterium]|nr:serine/threonine-protein phosphatase [Acidobacteriota bacterium]